MGSFAQSVLNVCLAWLRGVITGLWDIVNSSNSQSSMAWLGNNWLWLVIILAVGGVVVDYLVWFIRWRPFYVWRSDWQRFKRRLSGKQKEAPAPAKRVRATQPVYQAPVYQMPAGYAQDEDEYPVYEQQPYDPLAPYDAYEEDVTQTRQFAPVVEEQQELYTAYRPPTSYAVPQLSDDVYDQAPYDEEPYYEEPYYEESYQQPQQWDQSPDYPDYIEEPTAPPVMRTSHNMRQSKPAKRQGLMGSMAQRIKAGLGDNEEDELITYKPPKLNTDKTRAFHAPVYPRGWYEANDPDFREDD